MADTNETIAEIIAEKRRQADEIERDVAEKMKRNKMISDRYARELVADIRREADRLEAAHRRERGDAAKLREALKAIGGLCDRLMPTWDGAIGRIKDITEAALAAPPRNCDMPLVVDGPADNNADKAWIVFKRHNPDAYFDVPGLLRCIDWLLAATPEKEGGAK